MSRNGRVGSSPTIGNNISRKVVMAIKTNEDVQILSDYHVFSRKLLPCVLCERKHYMMYDCISAAKWWSHYGYDGLTMDEYEELEANRVKKDFETKTEDGQYYVPPPTILTNCDHKWNQMYLGSEKSPNDFTPTFYSLCEKCFKVAKVEEVTIKKYKVLEG